MVAVQESNSNIRLPELMNPGDYPYVRFEQFRDGSWNRTDETPNNESQATGHKIGSFEETDNSAGHKRLKVGQSWEYMHTGHTSTVDLNHHNKIGGSRVHQVSMDHHVEQGGNKSIGIGNDTVHASKGFHYQHATAGLSQSSVGDNTMDHNDGNYHKNIQGDKVTFIGGVKYENVNTDNGMFIGGNHDIRVIANAQIMANLINEISLSNVNVTASQNVNTTANISIVETAVANIVMTAPAIYANVTQQYLYVPNAQGTKINASAVISPAFYIGDPVCFVNTTTMIMGELAVSANGSNGLNGQVLTSNSEGTFWEYPVIGPAGTDQEIQFNMANATYACSGLIFNYASNNLVVSNNISANGISVNSISVENIVANGSAGNSSQILVSGGGASNVYWVNSTSISGGSFTPAGSNTDIQFNDSGNINAISSFAFSKTSNTLLIGNSTVNSSLNSTSFSGTSNNSNNLNGIAANNYQLNSTLNSNIASYLPGYAGLIGGTLSTASQPNITANNTSFVGSVSAANVVSNAQLQANLANYANITSPDFITSISVGSNLIINTSTLFIGNSTVNVHINSSSSFLTDSPGGNNNDIQYNSSGTFGGSDTFQFFSVNNTVSLGNSTVNTVVNTISFVNGNSTVNTVVNTSGFTFSNSGIISYLGNEIYVLNTSTGSNVNILAGQIYFANSTTSNFVMKGGVNDPYLSLFDVNGNVNINSTSISIGNSTVNAVINATSTISTSIVVGNSNISVTAVTGVSNSGFGVAGISNNNVGVYGVSNSNYAGYFISNAYAGIVAYSNVSTGVSGLSNSGLGVYGASNTSYGVYGVSNSYPGVLGISNVSIGVQGSSISSFGGYFTTTSGEGIYVLSNTGQVAQFANNNGAILNLYSNAELSGTGSLNFVGITTANGIASIGTKAVINSLEISPLNVGGDTYANFISNFPSLAAGGGSVFAWNYTNGAGELDLFINRDSGGSGGLAIWDFPNISGTISELLYLSGNGTLNIYNDIVVGSAGGSNVALTATSNNIAAIVSTSNSGNAIKGISNSGSGAYGISNTGSGLQANSNSGNGVVAISTSGYGIYGYSNSNYAGYFISNNYAGLIVICNTSTGIQGTSNSGYGIYGISNTSTGIQGISNSYVGIQGNSNTSVGVYGLSNSGPGLQGASNTNCGLYAVSNSYIAALGLSNTSTGVQGSSNSGVGGYFSSNYGISLEATGSNVVFSSFGAGMSGTNNSGYLQKQNLVTPEMFGAAGDGVTNDTVAVNNAINSGKAVFLQGRYNIQGQLFANLNTQNGLLMFGTGSGSQLILNTTSACLNLHIANTPSPFGTTWQKVNLHDFTIVPQVQTTASAVYIQGQYTTGLLLIGGLTGTISVGDTIQQTSPNFANGYVTAVNEPYITYIPGTGYQFQAGAFTDVTSGATATIATFEGYPTGIGDSSPHFDIRNVDIMPQSGTNGPLVGFEFFDCRNSKVRDCVLQGRYGQYYGNAIKWWGSNTSGPVEFHISGCQFYHWQNGMSFANNKYGFTNGANDWQGIYVTDTTVLAVNNCINATTIDGFSGWLSVSHCNFSYANCGVYAPNIQEPLITGNLFNAFNAGTNHVYGVYSTNPGYCLYGIIQGNIFQNVPSATNGVAVYSVNTTATPTQSSIFGNMSIGNGLGYVLSAVSGATTSTVANNVSS